MKFDSPLMCLMSIPAVEPVLISSTRLTFISSTRWVIVSTLMLMIFSAFTPMIFSASERGFSPPTSTFLLSVLPTLSDIDAEKVPATDYGRLPDAREDFVVAIAVVPLSVPTLKDLTGELLCPGLPVTTDEKDDDDNFSPIAQPGPQVSFHISPEFPPPDILLSEAPEHSCGEEEWVGGSSTYDKKPLLEERPCDSSIFCVSSSPYQPYLQPQPCQRRCPPGPQPFPPLSVSIPKDLALDDYCRLCRLAANQFLSAEGS